MAKFIKHALHAGQTFVSPDREVPVTRERLQHWADGFRRLTAAKYNVPIDWDHATTMDGLVPVKMSEQKKRRSAKDTVGELAGFDLAPDGNSAVLTFEVSDKRAIEQADANRVFVSPVILDKWKDGHGNEYSDVITHVDFVNHPVDYSQGPFIKATEPGTVALAIRMGLDANVCRLASDDDDEGNPFAKDGDGDGVAGEGAADQTAADAAPAKNPDMPPAQTDKGKVEAVLAGLNQKGIVLPSDFDFAADSALDILLAAINSSLKASQEAEAEAAANEEANDDSQGDFTVADPGYAALSLQAQTALNYAERQHRNSIQTRLDVLAKTGRCTPDERNAKAGLLGAVKLSLTAEGQPEQGDLEKWIESRESVPAGTFWSDEQKTRASQVVEPHIQMSTDGILPPDDAKKIADWALGKREVASK